MAQPNGRPLYEQVLDYARREIDEAASKIDELRQSLHLLEARVEAAKAVYESVAARLNLEDELDEGAEFQAAPYSDEPLPLQAPEPPEDREAPAQEAGNGTPEGFSVDLIRRHLEQKAAGGVQEAEAAKAEEASEAPDPTPSNSEAMDLIRRHLEQKAAGCVQEAEAEAEAAKAEEASEAPEPVPSEENSGFGRARSHSVTKFRNRLI